MKNRLIDLNNHLFSQMERLSEKNLTAEQIEQEVKRSEAIVAVSEQIIRNSDMECHNTPTTTDTTSVASGSLFRSAGTSFTYPVAFLAGSTVTLLLGSAGNANAWLMGTTTTTSAFIRAWSTVTGTAVGFSFSARGRWY